MPLHFLALISADSSLRTFATLRFFHSAEGGIFSSPQRRKGKNGIRHFFYGSCTCLQGF
jgi:hypothetical protein